MSSGVKGPQQSDNCGWQYKIRQHQENTNQSLFSNYSQLSLQHESVIGTQAIFCKMKIWTNRTQSVFFKIFTLCNSYLTYDGKIFGGFFAISELSSVCDIEAIPMAYCKTSVTPLLMHRSYCSLALSYLTFYMINVLQNTSISPQISCESVICSDFSKFRAGFECCQLFCKHLSVSEIYKDKGNLNASSAWIHPARCLFLS